MDISLDKLNQEAGSILRMMSRHKLSENNPIIENTLSLYYSAKSDAPENDYISLARYLAMALIIISESSLDNENHKE